MTAQLFIRILLRKDGKIIDAQWDIEVHEVGGVIPQIGDRLVQIGKDSNDGFRVVDRIFDYTGDSPNSIALVVEPHDVSDLEHLAHYGSRS